MLANIRTIPAFDAAKKESRTISFSWPDQENAPQYIDITIKNGEMLVYNKLVEIRAGQGDTSFALKPYSDSAEKQYYSSPLENGHTYSVWINSYVKDGNNNLNFDEKYATHFECIATPTFSFANLEGTVGSSGAYTFEFNYHQDNGKPIEQLTLKLRSNTQTESTVYNVSVSQVSMDEQNDAVLEYTISNLKNNQLYYIQAIGATSGGLAFDTGLKVFAPYEEEYRDFQFISAQNLSKSGGIRLSTSITSATGQLYNSDNSAIQTENDAGKPITTVIPFVDGDMVDLTKHTLVYNRGYIINDDFTICLICTRINPNTKVGTFEYKNRTSKKVENPIVVGELFYREGYDGSSVYHGYFEYIITSTYTGERSDGSKYETVTRRIYKSNVNDTFHWDNWKNKTFGQLSNFTWEQLNAGVSAGGRIGVILNRKGEHYSVTTLTID